MPAKLMAVSFQIKKDTFVFDYSHKKKHVLIKGTDGRLSLISL